MHPASFYMQLLVIAFVLNKTEGCKFGSGPECIFPCHCNGGAECDADTGECPTGCDDGDPDGYEWRGAYFGRGCQIGNIAYGKSASQVTYSVSYHASKAVDGNVDPHVANGFCSQAEKASSGAWWEVDLGDTYVIKRVAIYNNDDKDDRKCDEGFYGPGCLLECGHCICGIKGECKNGCSAGWRGENCLTPCEDGTWGAECRMKCNCNVSEEVCDSKTGECAESGCAENFVGTGCSHELLNVTITGVRFEGVTSTTIMLQIQSETNGGSEDIRPTFLVFEQKGEMNDSWILVKKVRYDARTTNVTVDDLQADTTYEFQAKLIVSLGNQTHTIKPSHLGNCKTLCEDRFWGEICEPCRCQNVTEVCNKRKGTCTRSGCSINYFGSDCEREIPRITTRLAAKDSVTSKITLSIAASNQGVQPDQYRIELQEGDEWRNLSQVKSAGDGKYIITIDNIESNGTYILRAIPSVIWNGQSIDGSPSPALIVDLPRYQSPINAIIGGVVGGLAILVIVLGAVILMRYKRSKVDTSFSGLKIQVVIGHATDNARPGEVQPNDGHGVVQGRNTPLPLPTQAQNARIEAEYTNESVENPIRLDQLIPYTVDLKKVPGGFRNEYMLIPSGDLGSRNAAKRRGSTGKNRFGDIHAYDHSRVVLKEREPADDYINANYIKGYRIDIDIIDGDENIYESQESGTDKEDFSVYCNINTSPSNQPVKPSSDIPHPRGKENFIAAQGPKVGTLRDFLQMIWQENANRIVMVTNLIEGGKNKCERYWPEQGILKVDEFTVHLVKEDVFAEYVIRELYLNNGCSSRLVHQFHFVGWPDHGVPDYATSLIEFRHRVRAFDGRANGPLIVHCSAGVGRTGTFIALDCLMDQAEKEGHVDVLKWTLSMRQQRPKMVQTLAQYVFIYDALVEASMSGRTKITCSEMGTSVAGLRQRRHGERNTCMQEQFEALGALRPPEVVANWVGLKPENLPKNRSPHIIPRNDRRPLLITPVDGRNDYINAVYVDGYRRRNAYLLTQMPLKDTVCDIWRLFWDHKVHSVVILNEPKLTEKPEEIYWPLNSEDTMEFGLLSVELVKCKVRPNFTLREMHLSNSNVEEPLLIRQYVIGCPGGLPPIDNLLEVIDHVNRWQQKSQNRPITIQCLDGVRLSGVYCAANHVLEKMQIDQEVDVFLAVKQIRAACPYLIENIEQYDYLHSLALAYIENNDTYANFR